MKILLISLMLLGAFTVSGAAQNASDQSDDVPNIVAVVT